MWISTKPPKKTKSVSKVPYPSSALRKFEKNTSDRSNDNGAAFWLIQKHYLPTSQFGLLFRLYYLDQLSTLICEMKSNLLLHYRSVQNTKPTDLR